MSCPGDNYIVPGANPCNEGGGGGVAGVTSLNSQSGVVNIVASDPSITVTAGANQISLSATLAGNVVKSLNGAIDDITIGSANGSVTVTTDTVAKTINLAVPTTTVSNITGSGVANVTSVGTVFNVNVPTPPSATVTNITGSGIATVNATGTVFNVDVASPDVSDILTTGIATVTNAGSVFTIDVPAPVYPVTSITGSGIATVTNVGAVYNVDVPATTITPNPMFSTITMNINGGLSGGILTDNIFNDFGEFNIIQNAVGNNLNIKHGTGNEIRFDYNGTLWFNDNVNGGIYISADGNDLVFDANQGELIGVSTINGVPWNNIGGGITSLNGLSGIPLDLVSSDNSVTITPGINTINLSVLDTITGVVSLNNQQGEFSLVSSDATLNIGVDGNGNIDLSVNAKIPDVVSLNGLDGALTLTSSDNSIAIVPSGTEIDLKASTGLDKLIAYDPIELDTVTNPGFFTIASSSPRIIAFTGLGAGGGYVNYNFITGKVIPLDTSYAVVASVSQAGSNFITRVTQKTTTNVQIQIYGGNGDGVELSCFIALFNYKPFVRKYALIPFAPMPQNIEVTGSGPYVNIPFTLPADYQLINNQAGVFLTMYFSGVWTPAFSNNISYGLFNQTTSTFEIQESKSFPATLQDYGTVLPSAYSTTYPGIVIDEANTFAYRMDMFVAPAVPISFEGHGIAILFEYWGYN